MLHRFFVLLYVLANVYVVTFSIGIAYDETNFLADLSNTVYQVRCDNGELVVLQGTLDGSPVTYDDRYLERNDGNTFRSKLRFYCANYEEIQYHINAYAAAVTPAERQRALTEYRSFEDSQVDTVVQNYTLEEIESDSSARSFFTFLLLAVSLLIGQWLILQVLRIAYLYVVFGKLVWHPYRKLSDMPDNR